MAGSDSTGAEAAAATGRPEPAAGTRQADHADHAVAATRQAVEAVWRIESATLIATLARLTRDVGVAEELAQDTLVVALETWPRTGVPDHPRSWLLATAKHRAIDLLRRNERYRDKLAVVGSDLLARQADDGEQERRA